MLAKLLRVGLELAYDLVREWQRGRQPPPPQPAPLPWRDLERQRQQAAPAVAKAGRRP